MVPVKSYRCNNNHHEHIFDYFILIWKVRRRISSLDPEVFIVDAILYPLSIRTSKLWYGSMADPKIPTLTLV